MPAHRIVTATPADFSVEQDRLYRLRGMIESHGADPSCILDTLYLVMTSKDWRKVPDGHGGVMTFRSYFKTLGWSQDELLGFVTQSRHKREKGPQPDPQTTREMEELRRAVRESVEPLLRVGRPEDNPSAADKEAEDNVSNRNISPKTKGGSTREYTLSRLSRDSSEANEDEQDRARKRDIYQRVVSGEISAHRGGIEAGWWDETIHVPKDPHKAAVRLLAHFRGERLEALIWALSEGLRAE